MSEEKHEIILPRLYTKFIVRLVRCIGARQSITMAVRSLGYVIVEDMKKRPLSAFPTPDVY